MKIALEYTGYLTERIVAIGADCDTLDMNATCEHYWSSGACDPIESTGLGLRYRIVDTDVPQWLINGIRRGQIDGRWSNHSAEYYAAKYVLEGDIRGWSSKLQPLCTMRGKFANSLRSFFETHGYLSDKQACFVK